jgi:hypothetical protein
VSLAFSVWTVTVQPRELATAMIIMLLGLMAIGGVWIALWALVSRVAFGESRWLRHAAIFFCALAARTRVDAHRRRQRRAGIYLPPFAAMWIVGTPRLSRWPRISLTQP